MVQRLRKHRHLVSLLISTLALAFATLSFADESLETKAKFVENLGQLEQLFQSTDFKYHAELLSSDAAHLQNSNSNLYKVHEDLLRRAALSRLIDTAFTFAVISGETKPLFSDFSYVLQNFPGLANYLNDLQKSYRDLESRPTDLALIRRHFLNLLVLNSFAYEGLQQRQTKSFEALKKLQPDVDKDALQAARQDVIEVSLAINEMMSGHPFLQILLLDPSGPAARGNKSILAQFRDGVATVPLYKNLIEAFQHSPEGLDKVDLLSQLMDQADVTFKAWIPAWAQLLETTKSQVISEAPEHLFAHGFVRYGAFNGIKDPLLLRRLKVVDRRCAQKWGFSSTQTQKQGSSEEETVRQILGWAGYIFSAPVGVAITAGDTFLKFYDSHALRDRITARAFVGLNDFEAFRIARTQSGLNHLIIGASHIGTGILLGRFGGSIGEKLLELPATVKGAVAALGRASEAPLSESAKSVATASLGAVKNFFSSLNGKAIALGIANMVASGTTFIEISMRQRNLSLVDLFATDKNFQRDFTFSMLSDFLLAFSSASNKPFMAVAMTLAGVSAFSSITASISNKQDIDWNRVSYDSSLGAYFSQFKYRYLAVPFANGLMKHVWTPLFPAGLSILGKPVKEVIVKPVSDFMVNVANNYVGNWTYVYLSRQIERDEIEEFLRTSMSFQLSDEKQQSLVKDALNETGYSDLKSNSDTTLQ